MASLMGSRRRADQFDAALDGRLPVDRAPADVLELVELVGAMRTLEVPAPRPEFSTALRESLMAEAETALAPASPLVLPPRRHGKRERRLTAAAAVFTLVGGTAGMAVAAQNSLPGDALYPIKRGIEDAQLGMQSDPDDRGRTYLEQAADRLDEADRLVAEDASITTIEETVDSFVVQAVAGADLLLGSFEEQQTPDDVQVLREFTATALDRLQTLAKAAEPDIQDELARAAVVLQGIDQQAAAACETCSDLPSLEMPSLMAQAAEISRAMEAVRTRQPSNDHPAMGGLRLPAGAGDDGASAGSEAGAPTLQPGGDQSSGLPSLGADSSGGLPGTREALDGIDKATGGLLSKVGDEAGTQTGETSQKLTDDLTDAVESTLRDSGLTGTTGTD